MVSEWFHFSIALWSCRSLYFIAQTQEQQWALPGIYLGGVDDSDLYDPMTSDHSSIHLSIIYGTSSGSPETEAKIFSSALPNPRFYYYYYYLIWKGQGLNLEFSTWKICTL